MLTEHEELEPDTSSEIRKHILALSNGDYVVRLQAAEILGKIGDESAIELLALALKDHVTYVRQAVVKALGNLGVAAIKPLLLALKDRDYNVRWSVVEALGNIGDERAVESLLWAMQAALKDEHYYDPKNVARALGKIGDVRAVDPLLRMLRDRFSDTRRYAAEALGKLGDAKTLPLSVVQEERLSPEQRIKVLARLRKLRYKDGDINLQYDLPELTGFFTQLLLEMGDQEAVKKGATTLLVELERQKQASSLSQPTERADTTIEKAL